MTKNSILRIPQLFENLRELFPRSAVLSRELQTLHVNAVEPLDLLSLTTAAQNVLQFFPMVDGDVLLLNDPSCGGLGPGDLTFVTRCQGFVLAFREDYPTPWNFAQRRDDEGLRIPPTPVQLGGVRNNEILKALEDQSRHLNESWPLAHQIHQTLDRLNRFETLFKKALQVFPDISDRDFQKRYFSFSREQVRKKIQDRFHGEAQSDLNLITGETLRLSVKPEDPGLILDFSGSSPSQQIFFPDSWVQSAATRFVLEMIQEKKLLNEGAFSAIKIIRPTQSFLNWKNPQPLWLARHWGSGLLWSALHLAFHRIAPQMISGLHDYFPLRLQWNSDGEWKSFELHSGSGSFNDREGVANFSPLSPGGLINSTLAGLESLGDFRILQLQERKPKAPKNSTSPGPGWTLKLQTSKNLNLRWLQSPLKSWNRLPKTLSTPESVELLIGDKVVEPRFGSLSLNAGDSLELRSGWGSQLQTSPLSPSN